ncbi:acetyl-CoA carboxylase carboxyltransferase subunit alpha [Microbispora sp. RL4-1S]|uniref:Multifunctional fusion protein n=2 Tax=Microbispora oryzae TaxID=2806554 RepID=A0A940WWK8_9ACTN|nr:acetyl-CoA carboxylase carboxyltransferase subunit alpha [Microbispora oryzae]
MPPVATATPSVTWVKCSRCDALVYVPRLERGSRICPECGHHQRLSAGERVALMLDEGSFVSARQVRSADPLGFTDTRPYPERLAEARERTGLADAVLHGRGRIGGRPVVVAVMDFAFMGGSMGSAVGEAVTRAAEEALATRTPLVVVTASGGARMQEGCLSLMQMAKTAGALRRLSEAGVLSVCVLTDPTFGGVTASFATLADVLIGEQGALIGFAGPRVIKAATRERLPEGFQTAAFLHERGMLDRVESRGAIRPLLARLLTLCGGPWTVAPDHRPAPGPDAEAGAVTDGGAWETVRTARDIARPTALDYIWRICDDFVELHGDRIHGDDPAIVGGPASIDGVRVMVIGHQKGHTTQELVARNFGMPHPEGYRKALRLMRLAERLGLPVVTVVDTQGAAPGVGAEERGQAWAIAETIAGMGELAVPVVATVVGEGGSGGALALAVADTVLMMEHACYSVISPESCSTILMGDPSHAEAMAGALRITASELLRLGVVDGVVEEPAGGTQASPADAAEELKRSVLRALGRLSVLEPAELRRRRADRFRRMGRALDD